MSVNRSGCFDDFLDRKQTDAIKGLFFLLVFLRHSLKEVRSAGFSLKNVLDSFGYRLLAD